MPQEGKQVSRESEWSAVYHQHMYSSNPYNIFKNKYYQLTVEQRLQMQFHNQVYRFIVNISEDRNMNNINHGKFWN